MQQGFIRVTILRNGSTYLGRYSLIHFEECDVQQNLLNSGSAF